MGKRIQSRSLNQNLQHVDVIAVKEQLDSIAETIGGKMIGETRVPGLLDMVRELSDKLNTMISQFAHAEDWRVKFKAAQADREEQQRRRQQQLEEREYLAAQKEKEIEQLRRDKRNGKLWAIGTGAAGFILSELIKYYMGK